MTNEVHARYIFYRWGMPTAVDPAKGVGAWGLTLQYEHRTRFILAVSASKSGGLDVMIGIVDGTFDL